jgi:uncharacterized protein YrrD
LKKSKEIIGLPVVSISEGRELGTVKDLIINAREGFVAALVIDDGRWYLGAKLLPFSAVAAIGEYAVTVESSNNLVGVTAEYETLLTDDIKVIGTKVLTKAGRIQGAVNEIIIDTFGKITTCEITENGEISNVPVERICTFGKEVLVVSDNEEQAAAASDSLPEPTAVPRQATTLYSAPVISSDETVGQSDSSTDDSAKRFDEKHRKYLLGKKASRRIETDNGMLIVDQGGEITEEVLQKAKLAGKFVELSMNIQ